MKHKIKIWILGCVVLMGLASFVAIADDMLPVNPIFRDKALRDKFSDESKMREVHISLDPLEYGCGRKRLHFRHFYKAADFIFTGSFIEKSFEKKVSKHVFPLQNLIKYNHFTRINSTFKVKEFLKSSVKFDNKIIQVAMGSPGKIGEEFIIYARMADLNGESYIESFLCGRNKPIYKQTIKYWEGRTESYERGRQDDLFFYGTLEYLKHRTPTLKEGKISKKTFEAEFRVKKIFRNTTEQLVHDKKIIRVLLNECREDPLLNQDYVFRVMPHKLEEIFLEQVARGEGDIYIKAQFEGQCAGMIMIDEVGAIRRLVKEERVNEVKALFEDAERGN